MCLKRLTRCISIVFALLMCVSFVSIPHCAATIPSEILLTYNYSSQMLTVNVSHYVPNTKTHYIENIEIQKNGLSILNRSYTNQSFNWGMYDTFSVSANVDDNITVTALCSKGYSLTSWLIVTSTTATNTPPLSTTSATETTTTDIDTSGTSLGTGPAIAAGATVVIFFILFFAWLKPEYVPDIFKQLGSRVRARASWFVEKLTGVLFRLRMGFGNLLQRITAKTSSK
jgi:hypothetical protein